MATLYKARAILGSNPKVEEFFTFDTLLGPNQKAVVSIFVDKDRTATFTRKQDNSKLTLAVNEGCPRIAKNRRYILLEDKTLILLERTTI